MYFLLKGKPLQVGYFFSQKMKEEIKNYSEVRMRNEITNIPNGIYNYEGYAIDNDGVIDEPLKLKVKIIVDNDYDFERLEEISNSLNRDLEIMIRFTPGIECHTHEYIKTGHLDSKFGFDPDQLESILIQWLLK